MSLTEFVPESEEEKENPYERIYLTANPFPRMQVLYEDKFIEFDEFTEKISNILNQSYIDGRTNSLVILGDNKMGKTHALLYIKHIINTLIFPRYKYLRAVYIHHPPDPKSDEKGGFHYTYREIIEGLDKEFFEMLADEISKKAQLKRRGLKEVRDIKGFLKERDVTEDLSLALDKWRNEEKVKDLAWAWIRGDKLSKKEMDELGVMRNIEASSRAIFVLNEIIKCCRLIFYKNFCLCVLLDDLEELAEQEKRNRIRYFADLRNLIDGVPEGLILILSMAPYGWDKFRDYGALQVRVQGDRLELKELDDEDALRYAAKYLEWGGDEYCRSKGKKPEEMKKIKEERGEPDYYPFTKEEIVDIFRQGLGDTAKPGIFLSKLNEEIENKLRIKI